jgi:D-alanyl-D-alanine carboxypeptidase
MLERGFGNNTLTWLRPSLGTVDNLAPIDASPPNLRDEMCSGKRHKPASDEDEDTVASSGAPTGGESMTFFAAGLQPPVLKPSELLAAAPAASEPIVVYTGPTRTGAALVAAVAADSDKQATPHRGKKTRVAAKKPDAAAEKPDPKSAAKPAAVKHADAKSDSKSDSAPKAAKPVAAADKPAKPAKPKAVAKPAAKPKSSTSDAAPSEQKTAAPRS